jgi:hypothetical protein
MIMIAYKGGKAGGIQPKSRKAGRQREQVLVGEVRQHTLIHLQNKNRRRIEITVKTIVSCKGGCQAEGGL